MRERFRSYQSERKLHGLKRARARRDADRSRKDIETLVKQQLTREYASGRFTGGLDAMKRELQRRVKERMMMSRAKLHATDHGHRPHITHQIMKIRLTSEDFVRLSPRCRLFSARNARSSCQNISHSAARMARNVPA